MSAFLAGEKDQEPARDGTRQILRQSDTNVERLRLRRHALGDMGLAGGLVTRGGPRLTYGNISVFHPAPFREIAPGTALRLFPWAYRFVDEGRVSGERYSGPWDNVGTADQLAALQERIAP